MVSSLDSSGSTLSGVVTFTVLRVETPVMFWVRLTQQQDERRFGSDDGLPLALARFYSNPEARKVVKMVESGLSVSHSFPSNTGKSGGLEGCQFGWMNFFFSYFCRTKASTAESVCGLRKSSGIPAS